MRLMIMIVMIFLALNQSCDGQWGFLLLYLKKSQYEKFSLRRLVLYTFKVRSNLINTVRCGIERNVSLQPSGLHSKP